MEPGRNIAAGDVLLPRLVVKQSALEYNIQRMAQHCREHGVSLAPRAKTTMSPGIMRRQAAAELEIGEVLGCSIIGPYNPAFATWRMAPLVDDRNNILEVLDVLY